MTDALRIRRSIEELQAEYEKGNKGPLEKLIRAWKYIKDLPPSDDHSFFKIAGFHGEPFRGAGWGTNAYWGGYCNHGNVLFPTWHRFYMMRIENALRTAPGCGDVAMPFWDEASEASKTGGIPWVLTVESFELEGHDKPVPNPFRSFVLNRSIKDHISPDVADYSKPEGYETVRYPFSGLVGEQDAAKTKEHNEYWKHRNPVAVLNQNIINWLTSYIEVPQSDGTKKRYDTNVAKKFEDCLRAPNYTLFSNTTSAAEWNDNVPKGEVAVVPLESPHNSIHLAVGGCDLPSYDRSPIQGANGDMGENDTASFDPIFFFHHCFIDRVFWLWQKRHAATDHLDVIQHYPGTNSVDNQGPTPGVAPNSWLDLDSPLQPFTKPDGTFYTSRDGINIEKQLGYTYGPGSLDDLPLDAAAFRADPASPVPHVHVAGISRAKIRGSFTISAFAVIDGAKQRLGTEAVLSRWHVEGCANCQTHLHARASIPLHGFTLDSANASGITVEVRTHDDSPDQIQPIAFAASGTSARATGRFTIR